MSHPTPHDDQQPEVEDMVASWQLDKHTRMDQAIGHRDHLVAAHTSDPDAGRPVVTADPDTGVQIADVNLTDLTGRLETAALTARHALTPASTLDTAGLMRILDTIRRLTGILAALEMLVVCLLDIRVRTRDAERDVPARRQGRATAGLVGIATHTSPSIARMSLRAAQRITTMPGMFTALVIGRLTPRDTAAVGTRTAGMTPAGRNLLDAALVEHLPEVTGAGAGRWSTIITRTASILEPDGAARRHRIALEHRHVKITPAAHGMAHINLYVDGLDAAAFTRHNQASAHTLKAEGDMRTVAQIQADTALDDLLGRSPDHEPVSITVDVAIDAATLLSPAEGPDATIPGAGSYPSRTLIDQILTTVSPHGDLREHLCPPPHRDQGEGNAGDESGGPPVGPPGRRLPLPPGLPDVIHQGAVQLRRVFTDPATGQLVAAESRARAFPPALARLIRLRDDLCRAPYCDAPIQHIDHVIDHAAGGPTSQADGQGLCAFHNYLKNELATVDLADRTGDHQVHWRTLINTVTTRPDPLTGPDLPTARQHLNPPHTG
jgi:hypothetical protein